MNTYNSDQNCEYSHCDYRVANVAASVSPLGEEKDKKLLIKGVNGAAVPQTVYISSKDLLYSGATGAGGTFYGEVKLGPKDNVLYSTVSFFSRINVYANAKLDKYQVDDVVVEQNKSTQKRRFNVFNTTTSSTPNAKIDVPLNRASAFDDMEVTYHQNSFLGTCVGRFIAYPQGEEPKKLMLSGIEVLPSACNPAQNKEFMYWGNPNQPVPNVMSATGYPLTFNQIGSAGPLTVNSQKVLLGNYYDKNGSRGSLLFADPDVNCDTFLVDAKIVEKAGGDNNAYLKLEFKNGSKALASIPENTVLKININH